MRPLQFLALASISLALACTRQQQPPDELPGSPIPEERPVLSAEDCESRGGRIVGDPGDGSVHRNGCPSGERLLGTVRQGIEGGICCAPAAAE